MMRHLRVLLGFLLLPALAWGQAQVINGNRVHAGWVNYGTTAGTATAYTLTFTPALAGYVTGQCFLFKPHMTNTSAATLNVQGKGALTLTKLSGGALVPVVAGDLLLNRLVQACYDGTSLQLMGTAPDATGAGVTDGDKQDITVSSSGTVWTIDTTAVTYAKIQNVSQTARLLGRNTVGAGPIEELTVATVKAMLGMTFGDISGAATDAQLPDLNTLGTGLTPSRCVETDATGKLGVAAGACGVGGATTGISGATNHGLMVATGGTTGTSLGVATNGQLPIGSTGANPVLASLAGTPNQIAVTPGPGSITLSIPTHPTLPGTTTANLGNATNLPLSTGVTGDLSYANLTPATAASRLLGRGSPGAGDWQEITLGSGLTMSGTTLNTVAAGDAGIVCDGTTMVSAAIQTLLDTVPVGTKVVLPGGNCMLNSSLTISRSIALHGAGMDHTYLKQTVTTLPVLTVTSINVHVVGMTLMHNTSPVAGGDGLIVRAPNGASLQGVWLYDVSASWNWRGFVLGCMTYGLAHQVVAQKNNAHGFEFLYEAEPGCGVDQWDVLHANATLNVGVGFYGYNTTYAFGLGPFLWNTTSFGNNQGGYIFQGTPGHPINDLRFHHALSSADNVAGIYLDTYGGSHLIVNPWIEYTGSLAGFPIGFTNTTSVKSNTGHCLAVSGNNGAITITGGLYWNCSWAGVALYAPYTTMVGGTSLGNGQALDANLANRAGVTIGGNGVHLGGHSFQFPGATTLNYIHLAGALNNLAIGQNTYANDLSPQNFLVNQATITAARLPALVAGLSVHTNTAASPGLQLYDATQGASPLKSMRVTGGHLQTLNATGSAVIQGLSDEGTPSWPNRRGQTTVVDGNVSVNVGLASGEPDTGYFVQLTVVGTAGSPAAGALTVSGVTKFTTGFEITVTAAPGAGKSVTYDWLVHR